MTTKTRHNFNLVEITLAMAVLAIGMSSTLLLFTAGANTGVQANIENDIADAVTFVYAQLRGQLLKTAPTDKSGAWSFTDAPDVGTTFQTGVKLPTTAAANGWKQPDGTNDAKSDTVFCRYGTDQIYLFRRLSGGDEPSADFSALILVKKDNGSGTSGFENAYFPAPREDVQKTYSTISFNEKDITKYALPLKIEIRYPAETSYEKQESRIFRVEFFNDKFQVTPEVTP